MSSASALSSPSAPSTQSPSPSSPLSFPSPPTGPIIEWPCDLTRADDVRRLIAETLPDLVLHLAGRNAVGESWREPLGYLQANVMSTFNLLDALRARPASRIVVAGSMLGFPASERPDPPHPYSLSKAFQAWGALGWGRLFGQPVIVAKPSNLIGPGPSTGICALLARRAAELEKGRQAPPFSLSSAIEERDYLDVRDAVRAYEALLAAGEPGGVYPVASGVNRSLGAVAAAVQQQLGRPLPLRIGSLDGYLPPAPVDIAPMCALGWRPVIPFEQSLRDALDYFRTTV
uniref:NAD-dependent epimerase/dehydratase domain-containing protein n=2 Tax=Paenibacillus athensensis TaxID=1967502 RepID=A0A4Y8PQQ2_9BACL